MRRDRARKQEDFVLPIAHAVVNVSVNASEGYIAENSAAATKSDALILDTPQSISVVTNEHSNNGAYKR
jgi:outer membrane receptor protein involved in Fe transport